MLQELETALAARLLPMQDDGFRVLGAPTDHQAVGRVFGKGEIRVGYQSQTYQSLGDRIERRVRRYPCTITFEVVIELQDMQMNSHPYAAQAMEQVVSLIAGFNPSAGCGSGFRPVKNGFVGRSKEDAVWIYSAVFSIDRVISVEQKLEAIA
jgi:hypothetical protein